MVFKLSLMICMFKDVVGLIYLLTEVLRFVRD